MQNQLLNTWLRDTAGRVGQVVAVKWAQPPTFHTQPRTVDEPIDQLVARLMAKDEDVRLGLLVVVDWGAWGITAVMDFKGSHASGYFRWPVPPHGFEPGLGAVFERWRAFALHPVTGTCHAICPCCGYPHLDDDDPIELMDCPLCGWELDGYAALHQQPPQSITRRPFAAGVRATLGVCRTRLTAHGDVFPLNDAAGAAWWRRPDVAALRASLRQSFDQWLQAPEPKPRLPLDDWQRLDWTGRRAESALYDPKRG